MDVGTTGGVTGAASTKMPDQGNPTQIQCLIATSDPRVSSDTRQHFLQIILKAIHSDPEAHQAIGDLARHTDFYVEFKVPNRRKIITPQEARMGR